MKNLKIGTRLTLGFLCIQILIAIIVVIGAFSLANIIQANLAADRAILSSRTASAWQATAQSQADSVLSMTIATDAKDLEFFSQKALAQSKYINELEKILQDIPNKTVQGAELLKSTHDKRMNYRKNRIDITEVLKSGNREKARQMVYDNLFPARDAYVASVNQYVDFQKSQEVLRDKEIKESLHFSRWLLIGSGVAIILLGIIISLTLTRSITTPLNEAVKIAETVASGDLTSDIKVNSKDETGQLMQALKNMNEGLLQATSRVRDSAEAIATASAEIAQGNQDLSSRTEHQAGSLQETASSMEELTSTVRQNGDNARQANQLSANAAQVAHRNGELAQQVMQTMNDIHESSRKIVDIISVIDGIAFQTNILALNASVEAARAGEQGRGFAVVAGEVRNLAQRSASAAREIKTLIDDSVSKVDNGRKLVNAAGETMQEMVTSIQNVNDIMNEISAATQEQVAGIEQVNQAVTEMDTVSQQNAALVEEAAAAAESLRDQAGALVEVAAQFKMPNTQGAVAAAPAKSGNKPAASAQTASSNTAMARAITPQAPVSKPVSPTSAPRKPAAADDGDWEEF